MRFYQFPKWFRSLYPGAIWDFFLLKEKTIYLTFDDGPQPASTPLILDILAKYDVKATFFCLGSQVKLFPELFEKIRKTGHQFGNHGMHHLDGFKTSKVDYVKNAGDAAMIIPSALFRPPYGHIKKSQFSELKKQGFQLVFWSLLTYDFDKKLNSEQRMALVQKKTKPGSIVVFHDSVKAIDNLKTELPKLLDFWIAEGYSFGIL